MFHEAELAALIGGTGEPGLDIADLRAHVVYAGGYHADHPIVHHLWQARYCLLSKCAPPCVLLMQTAMQC